MIKLAYSKFLVILGSQGEDPDGCSVLPPVILLHQAPQGPLSQIYSLTLPGEAKLPYALVFHEPR